MTKPRTERGCDTKRDGAAVSTWVLPLLVLLVACTRSTAATRAVVDATVVVDVEDATPRDTPTNADSAVPDVVSAWSTCNAGPVLDANVLGLRVRGTTALLLFRGDAVTNSIRSVPRACEPGRPVRPHLIRYTVRDGTAPIVVRATARSSVTMWATARCEDIDEALACHLPVIPWVFGLTAPDWMVVPPRPAGSSLYVWVAMQDAAASITIDEHPEFPTIPCRTSTPRCDRGYACTAPHALAAGSCVPAAAHDRDCRALGGEPLRACDGEDCVPGTSGWRCAPLGSLHARCRAGATACDDGLVCTPSPGTSRGFQTCEVPLPSGAPCVAFSQFGACPGDEVCPRDGGVGRCGARGLPFAECRDAAPRCDPGLECRESSIDATRTCYPTDHVGAPCRSSEGCPDALGCLVDPATSSGTCRTPYVRGGPCFGACYDGSACHRTGAGSGLCVAPLRLGDACSYEGERSCGQDMTCVAHPDGSARCARDGTEGAYRRLDAHPCDEGLVPTPDGLCRWPFGLGDACGVRPCTDGSSCVRGVCRAEGTLGARCRRDDLSCDDGLACVGHEDSYVCITAQRLGEPCIAPGEQSASCIAGTECRAGFCAAPLVVPVRCRNVPPGEPRCEDGRRCLHGFCWPTAARDAQCRNIVRQSYVACREGDHCAFGDGEAFARCRAPGTPGGEARATEPFCDDGLVRMRVSEACWAPYETSDSATICVRRLPPGSACNELDEIRRCPDRSECIRSTCEVRDTCDPRAPSCEPGHVCHAWPEGADLHCQPTAREGQPCGATAPVCEEPLECRDGACARASYDVTVLRDVVLDDPCVQALGSGWAGPAPFAQRLPFSFTVLNRSVRGAAFTAEDAFLLPVVSVPSDPPSSLNPPQVWHGLAGVTMPRAVLHVSCTKVFGEAPMRRYVVEVRGVGVDITTDPGEDGYGATGAMQLILHERTQIVELAFRAFVNTLGVPRRLVAAPQLRRGAQIVGAPAASIAEGTVFRFTPR